MSTWPGSVARSRPRVESPPAPVQRTGPEVICNVIETARLIECCASARWVELMEAQAPYGSGEELLAAADQAFDALAPADWRQAFAAHARIGEPKPGDQRAGSEQAGAAQADPATLEALRADNAVYEERFGHVFLIRAAGLSGPEMLAALHQRLQNPPDVEFHNATEHQRQITRLRLLDMTR